MRACGWCDMPVADDANACPSCGSSDVRAAVTRLPVGETNSLAVVALVLAVLWLGGLGSAAAVVLAATARNQIDEREERGRGLADAAMALGVLGLLGAAVLGAVVFMLSI